MYSSSKRHKVVCGKGFVDPYAGEESEVKKEALLL